MKISMTTGRHAAALPLFPLTCLGLSWATRLLAIKESSHRGLSPVETAAAATIGIVLLLTIVALVRSKFLPIERRHLRFYALAGLFGFGAPFLLEVTVAPHLPALLFVIIVTSTPIWTVFVAIVLGLEPASWQKSVGVAAGFAAAVLIILGTGSATASDGFPAQPAWIAAAFGVPVLYAVYVLYIAAAWPPDMDNLQGAYGQSIVALAVFATLWIALPGRRPVAEVFTNAWPMAAIVISEFTALLLLFHVARSYGGGFAAQANYIAVAAGSLMGPVVFDDEISGAAAAGILLLVFALRLSRWA